MNVKSYSGFWLCCITSGSLQRHKTVGNGGGQLLVCSRSKLMRDRESKGVKEEGGRGRSRERGIRGGSPGTFPDCSVRNRAGRGGAASPLLFVSCLAAAEVRRGSGRAAPRRLGGSGSTAAGWPGRCRGGWAAAAAAARRGSGGGKRPARRRRQEARGDPGQAATAAERRQRQRHRGGSGLAAVGRPGKTIRGPRVAATAAPGAWFLSGSDPPFLLYPEIRRNSGEEDEDIDHLFVLCPYSNEVWQWTLQELDDQPLLGLISVSVVDTLRAWNTHCWHWEDCCVWWLILHVTIWVVWTERNRSIFLREARTSERTTTFIKNRVKEWASEPYVTEDELKLMLRGAELSGAIEEEEQGF
ncbi:hypothetical protein Taro_020916 [Colocasia esculenta]|uniref:Uncharacterized protein n=1 Tax=Colocasia esculenta TaxID=4460 RepID=A0A843UXL4_COLES|nr:hypothetical protein [Colocasia esculenta]